jgi:hypothetical protein
VNESPRDPASDAPETERETTAQTDAPESGAVIRSPAPTPVADEDQHSHVRWPWDKGPNGEEAGTESRIDTGPPVRTEKLYRSAGYTDPSTGEYPLQEPTAAPAERIEPMAAVAPPVQPDAPEASPRPESGLSTIPVFLIIFGITTAVGLVDMYLNRQFTYLTGASFVIASIIGALIVRPRDLWTAVISPPIAFLAALIVAGQPTTITGTGSLILREASLIGTGLAFNAPFVFGGTIAALIIVLIRRPGIKRG